MAKPDGRLQTTLEVKAVDVEQRIIEGYAATFGNLDLNGDVIQPGAFDNTLAEQPPGGVAVFIGHQSSALPVGIPLEISQDARGLYTKTRIFKTSAGDDLLATARELQAAGQPLGMSIGFQTRDSEWASKAGKQFRLLTDVALKEYSYAANQVIASPPALVVSVKTKGDNHVSRDEHFQTLEQKTVWSTSYRNALPDDAFAYVEPTGETDSEAKTTPRTLRHFPHHDASGKVDLDQVANALRRAPQSPFGAKAMSHLEDHAKANDIGERGDAAKIAQEVLGNLSTTLADLSDEAAECATDLAAADRLGMDGQKVSVRLKGTMRGKLKSIQDAIEELRKWADGEDDAVDVADAPKTHRSHLRSAAHAAHKTSKTIGDLGATDLGSLHNSIKTLDTLHDSVCPGGEDCELMEPEDEDAEKAAAAASEEVVEQKVELTGFETTITGLEELEQFLAGVGVNGTQTS